MPKVYAPNTEYTGVSAGVYFVNGVGETEDERALLYFRDAGYRIEGEDGPAEEAAASEPSLEDMSATALRDLARERGIKGYSTMSKDELIEALKGANE